jgi:anti-sigma regulatory factor (Ser/Thr protein kinase)
MSEPLWPHRPPAAPDPGAPPLGHWRPASPADLTAARRELSAALHDSARPPDAREGAVERLLLAFEELASNALRHGRDPVEVRVSTSDGGWLLEVSDAATDLPPTPAVDRDPALGGLGLHLVAQISAAHGWTVDDAGHKVVWAYLRFTRDESPAWGSVPRPRGEGLGRRHEE